MKIETAIWPPKPAAIPPCPKLKTGMVVRIAGCSDYFIVRDKERIYLGFLDTIIEGVPAPHKQSNNLLQTNFGFFTIDTVWPSVAEYYREKYSTRD